MDVLVAHRLRHLGDRHVRRHRHHLARHDIRGREPLRLDIVGARSQQVERRDHAAHVALVIDDRRAVDLFLDEQPVDVGQRRLGADGQHVRLHEVASTQ